MNDHYKYLKYKNKYEKLKIHIGGQLNELSKIIKLYYGLYEIQYKINNDYKLNINSDETQLIINYLNNEKLANKCFNNCNTINENEEKYCKIINKEKCVPNCITEDNLCEKTQITIQKNKTSDYTNKKINSKYSGKTNYITKLIYLELKQYIVIIKIIEYIVILFPSGYRYSKKELEDIINFDNLYEKIFKDDGPNTKYIFAGHSMGLTILMILITYGLLKNNPELEKRCFIVGSGGYLWCHDYNIVNEFIIKYENRYIFFGNGIELNDKIILDDYLFVSGLDDMKSKINLYGFPTKFIIEKTELKESIDLFDKILEYSDRNTVLNIIPKYESLDCKNEELHMWNVYVDGIKIYLEFLGQNIK